MPETYRDRKRQAAWIKAEARRQVAQEQADALTALGVPCAVRSGWVALLDPFGLLVKLDPNGAVTGWPQTAATEATLPAVTTPAPEPHSGKGGGSDAAEGRTERATGGPVGKGAMFRPDPSFIASSRALDRLLYGAVPGGYSATQWPSEGEQG